jgi:hypothetical protein
MNVSLPKPTGQYDYQNEVETRRQLETAFNDALSRQETITLQPGQNLVLTSPNGTRYAITVDNTGALGTTAV